MERIKLIHDSLQNYKVYQLPKCQMLIVDPPYKLGDSAFASSPSWYVDGDNKNGESELARAQFFYNDNEWREAEFWHFASKMLIKEPKDSGGGKSPCMLIFCAFEQQMHYIELAQKHGFKHYINLVFRKNYSPQVLKANMKIVGCCEYGLIFYRDKLPKFNNDGRMVFNCIDWVRDTTTPKIHPTQKPVPLLEYLIKLFTDEDDVVIDCCAGSGSTLLAAGNLNRRAYGFEVNKEFVNGFYEKLYPLIQPRLIL